MVGGFDGEDIPRVGGDDPSTSLRTGSGGEEVDLVGAVGDSVGVEVAFVGVAAVEDGAPPRKSDNPPASSRPEPFFRRREGSRAQHS